MIYPQKLMTYLMSVLVLLGILGVGIYFMIVGIQLFLHEPDNIAILVMGGGGLGLLFVLGSAYIMWAGVHSIEVSDDGVTINHFIRKERLDGISRVVYLKEVLQSGRGVTIPVQDVLEVYHSRGKAVIFLNNYDNKTDLVQQLRGKYQIEDIEDFRQS